MYYDNEKHVHNELIIVTTMWARCFDYEHGLLLQDFI